MDKSKMAIDVFNKRAAIYQDKFMDVDLYRDTFNLFCNSITKPNVLDIGCGPGNIAKYLLEKRPDLNILGIDLAPNMVSLAKKNNPRAVFQLMDVRDIGSLGKKYEGIMCGFCLPYLSNVEVVQLISDVSKLLIRGGPFYLSTMEDEDSRSGFETSSLGDKLYVYYHHADDILKALKNYGFDITDLQRRSQSKSDGTKMTDIIIIAVKQDTNGMTI